jgi:hypothetical protein
VITSHETSQLTIMRPAGRHHALPAIIIIYTPDDTTTILDAIWTQYRYDLDQAGLVLVFPRILLGRSSLALFSVDNAISNCTCEDLLGLFLDILWHLHDFSAYKENERRRTRL